MSSDPMGFAVDVLAEELLRARRGQNVPVWTSFCQLHPDEAACLRADARMLIERARLAPRIELLDLGVKRALVGS